jgi:transglutaminase-like putative cysteine protease
MRRRSKFLLAVSIAVLMLMSPLAASWFVESSYETPDYPSDLDGDGLRDSQEEGVGTSPHRLDTDGDGLNDGWEVRYWRAMTHRDEVPAWILPFHDLETQEGARALLNPDRDLDLDGSANAADADADGDGLNDGEEVDIGTNPADPDSDGDGVWDGQDPRPLVDVDIDDDGLPDDWEAHHGIDDPLADDDGDGLANQLELIEGTSPSLAFGQIQGMAVDLRDLYNGAALDSMGDLYASFREPDGSLDMDRPLFQVDPTTPGRYWRLLDLKTWSASGWSHDLGGASVATTDGPPDATGLVPSYVYDISFNGRWSGPVPAPLYSVAITGLPSDVEVSRDVDGTFSVVRGHLSSYSITSLEYVLGAGTERNASSMDGEYAWLPTGEEELPPELAWYLDSNLWTRVLEARYWLWERAEFSNLREYWPLNAPLDLTVEGHGTALDFASALTVLCRKLDVPARVAVGFTPGILTGGHRVVRVGDLHAWTEVYLKGQWVPVEATYVHDSRSGLGLASAGHDATVVPGDHEVYYDPIFPSFPMSWGASGGALTSGSGGMGVLPDRYDTDEDGIPDVDDNDDDGDGLTDVDEWREGTNPIDPDTDHDGLNDALELVHGTSPVNGDSDGDGIADGIEVHHLGTDPLDRDTDGSGSCDIQELEHRTDPLDPEDDYLAMDWDCDGLIDEQEVARGTNPRGWDTDLDGISDPDELDMGTDPTDADTDGDGVPDGEELNRGTDPILSDSDDDGLDDGEELGYIPDLLYVPSDPNLVDTDGDGLDDAFEASIGTRPDRVDHDGDGLTDQEERLEDLSPLDADSDGDGVDDREGLARRDLEDRVEAVRDGAIPIFLALTILSAAMATRYRPFDRRIVPDIIEGLSELEEWLASLHESPDDEVRRAIYRAYERLCAVLADYGYLRRRAWTVREFETAVRDALPWVPDELLMELTRLFEEARYSDHELTQGYIERARSCLAGIREALEGVMGKTPEAAEAAA